MPIMSPALFFTTSTDGFFTTSTSGKCPGRGGREGKRKVIRRVGGEGVRGMCAQEEACNPMNNGEQLYYFHFLK